MLKKTPLLRLLILFLVLITGLYLLNQVWDTLVHFSDVLLLFFTAWLIAFILSPLADYLHRQRVPRFAAVGSVYLLLFIVIVAAAFLLVPIINNQIQQVVQLISSQLTPQNSDHLGSFISGQLHRLGIQQHDTDQWVNSLVSDLPKQLSAVGTYIFAHTASLGTIVSSFLTLLIDTVVVLIVSFYLMLDGAQITTKLISLLPLDWRADARILQESIDKTFGGYIRGQLILGLVYGVLTWIVMGLFHLDNAFVISVFAGLTLIIPFIGPALAIIPPLVIALIQYQHNLPAVVGVLVALFICQQLVLQVVAPRVLGSSVGMHPLLVFAALLVGAKEAGVWGAVFGIPVAGVGYAMASVFYQRWATLSPLFNSPKPPPEPAPFRLKGVLSSLPEDTERAEGAGEQLEQEHPAPASVREQLAEPVTSQAKSSIEQG